jgi:hypothetical protein
MILMIQPTRLDASYRLTQLTHERSLDANCYILLFLSRRR